MILALKEKDIDPTKVLSKREIDAIHPEMIIKELKDISFDNIAKNHTTRSMNKFVHICNQYRIDVIFTNDNNNIKAHKFNRCDKKIIMVTDVPDFITTYEILICGLHELAHCIQYTMHRKRRYFKRRTFAYMLSMERCADEVAYQMALKYFPEEVEMFRLTIDNYRAYTLVDDQRYLYNTWKNDLLDEKYPDKSYWRKKLFS